MQQRQKKNKELVDFVGAKRPLVLRLYDISASLCLAVSKDPTVVDVCSFSVLCAAVAPVQCNPC